VRVLVAIGGDAAASELSRLVASDDPVLRRAVLEGADSGKEREPVRAALLVLCDDGDARVRAMALRKLMPVMTEPELLARAKAPDDETRARAIDLAWKHEERDPATLDRGLSQSFMALLRDALVDPSELVQKTVQGILKESICLRSQEGRRLWLEAISSDVLNAEARVRWENTPQQASSMWFDVAPPAALLVETAHRIATLEQRGLKGADPARRGFGQFVQSCTLVEKTPGNREVRDDPWPKNHAALFELARLGYFSSIEAWVARRAIVEDLPDLVSMAGVRGAGSWVSVAAPLLPKARELPPALQTSCIEHLSDSVRAHHGDMEESAKRCLEALVRMALPASDQRVVELLREWPEPLVGAWNQLLQRSDPPPSNDVLADLIVIPGRSPRDQNDASLVRSLRLQTVRRLADARDPRLPERMAAAYRAGLPWTQGRNRGALLALFSDVTPEEADQSIRRLAPRFPAETLAAAIRDCGTNSAGESEFWVDLQQVIKHFPDGEKGSDEAGVAGMSRAIGSVLANVTKSGVDGEYVLALIGGYVGKELPGWVEFATTSLDDPHLNQAIVQSLRSLPPALVPGVVARAGKVGDEARGHLTYLLARSTDPTAREALVGLLHDESFAARTSAITAIADEWPDQIVALVGPLARDRDSRVRFAVAKALVGSFDRKAIPLLVELLRDSSAGVRGTARESLDQLQYYFDSKLRWERLLSESGIDANNAAEALLKQARSGATVEVRKAAIDSLGTLKVPEALPFLIELMADPDPTLAAAARAAITKINQ
jgi:hypothetical protein